MDAILAIPLPLRVAVLGIVGCCVASAVHYWLDRLREESLPTSPWSPPPQPHRKRKKKGAEPARRPWLAYVPVVGWLVRDDESRLLPQGFWVRPMLVELGLGVLFGCLYVWEIEQLKLMPLFQGKLPPVIDYTTLHVNYLVHVTLIVLMLTASLIDMEETIIPDAITVPGALVGIVVAAVFPWSLLPIGHWVLARVLFLTLCSPTNLAQKGFDISPWLEGGQWSALGVGLLCLWSWNLALNPRLIALPLRWRKFRSRNNSAGAATRIIAQRLWSDPAAWIGLLVTILIAVIWRFWPEEHWAGLLSALVGMAVGGLVVWVVRIIGRATLGKEAMGFGDVTLMSMIGAFLGWQSTLVIFFLAPFVGLVAGIIQWLVRGGRAIPYGPFLCLAALVTILYWSPIWTQISTLFFLGWTVQIVLGLCAILMAVLLGLMRGVRKALGIDDADEELEEETQETPPGAK